MGDNLFNTFSFNVWKSNKEEEIKEKRNKKRRKKQVAKLKKALKEKKIGSKTGGGGGDGADLEKVLRALIEEGDDSDLEGDGDESDIDADLLTEVRKDAYYQPDAAGGPPPAAQTPLPSAQSPSGVQAVPMMMVPVASTPGLGVSPSPTPSLPADDSSGWRFNRPPGANRAGPSPAPPANLYGVRY